MGRPVVTVDPAVRFGQPTIGRTPTEAVAAMVAAGEPPASVCDEYGLTVHEVLLACWWEGTCGHFGSAWEQWAEKVFPALVAKAPDVEAIPPPPHEGDVMVMARPDDNYHCEPLYDDNGDLVAVARVDPNMSDSARAALVELVEAAKRRFADDLAADPSIGERQAESIRRIRARVNRESRIKPGG